LLGGSLHGDFEFSSLRYPVVENLLQNPAFCFKLQWIFHVLPLASAANPKVPASRGLPAGARLENFNDPGLDQVPFFFFHLHPQTVSRNRKRNEYDLPLVPAQPESSINELFHRDFEGFV
jgi:hypothetical protein